VSITVVNEVADKSPIVDFFRGPRDYLRASDLINAAPLHTEAIWFDLRYRAMARHPGRWCRLDPEGFATDAGTVATLVTACPSHLEHWSFVVDRSVQVTNLLPDVDETAMLSDIALLDDGLLSRLQPSFSLWDQLIAAARAWAMHHFTGRRWYIVRLTVNRHALQPPPGTIRLGLTPGRRHGRFLEIHFDLDGAPAGRLGCMIRDACSPADQG
jgi:hypothetical protein